MLKVKSKITFQRENILNVDNALYEALKDFVGKAINATPFHDIDFNIFISKYFKIETKILIAYLNNNINGILIYCQDDFKSMLYSPYQKSLATYGGPIALNNEHNVCPLLLQESIKQCRRKGYSIYIKSPPNAKTDLYKKLGFKTKNIPTLLIDINRSEEEIWNSLDNRIRRNIKKAWKENITVNRKNGDSVEHLTKIYKELCDRKNLTFQSENYYSNLKNSFNSYAKFSIFLATKNEEIISAMSVLEFNKLINPWFGGTRHNFLNTGAGSLVYWEILKYGCKNNYHIFDFLGLDVGPIAFYKKGFGGFEANVVHATYKPIYLRVIDKIKKTVKCL